MFSTSIHFPPNKESVNWTNKWMKSHHFFLSNQFHLPADGQKIAAGENNCEFDRLRKHNQWLREVKSKEINLSIAVSSFSKWEKFQRRKEDYSGNSSITMIGHQKHSPSQSFIFHDIQHDNSTDHQKAEKQWALWQNGVQDLQDRRTDNPPRKQINFDTQQWAVEFESESTEMGVWSYQEHTYEANEKTCCESVDSLLNHTRQKKKTKKNKKTQERHQRGGSYKTWVCAESVEKTEEKREVDLHGRERTDSIWIFSQDIILALLFSAEEWPVQLPHCARSSELCGFWFAPHIRESSFEESEGRRVRARRSKRRDFANKNGKKWLKKRDEFAQKRGFLTSFISLELHFSAPSKKLINRKCFFYST